MERALGTIWRLHSGWQLASRRYFTAATIFD
jgi:hypothetical protein